MVYVQRNNGQSLPLLALWWSRPMAFFRDRGHQHGSMRTIRPSHDFQHHRSMFPLQLLTSPPLTVYETPIYSSFAPDQRLCSIKVWHRRVFGAYCCRLACFSLSFPCRVSLFSVFLARDCALGRAPGATAFGFQGFTSTSSCIFHA